MLFVSGFIVRHLLPIILCFMFALSNTAQSADLSPFYDPNRQNNVDSSRNYNNSQISPRNRSVLNQTDMRTMREDDFRGTKIVIEPASLPMTQIDYRVIQQPLSGVLDRLSQQSGVTIQNLIKGKKTVTQQRLQGSIEDVLNELSQRSNFQWMTLNNTILAFDNARVETRFYDVNNSSIKDIITTLQRAGIGGPGISLLVDNRQNFIRASGPKQFLDEFDEIIAKSDRSLIPTIVRYGRITEPQGNGSGSIRIDTGPSLDRQSR